ncbi:unnamed protein product [Scytosiphon promiscuus]
MAEATPLPYAGSSCDFCNRSPATRVVRGHLVCEIHKDSETIDDDFSAYAPPSGLRPSGVKNSGSDGDDDVIEAWEPPAALTGWPPSPPPQSLLPVWGATNSGTGPNGSRSARGGGSSSAPFVAAFPLGSPAAPLTVSSEADERDDDVEFAGGSLGAGVVNPTGASPPALPLPVGAWGFGGVGGAGGSGSGGGSKGPGAADRGHPRRARPRAEPTGIEVIDLVDAPSLPAVTDGPSAPRTKRRNSIAGGAGVGGDDRHERRRRRSGGSDEVAHEDPPITAAQGKGKRRKAVEPEVSCIVCFESSPVSRSARCAEGHAMCKTCVTSYVTETLMPQGTVFWDRIKCGGSSTCGHLFGPSVTSVLPRTVVKKVETKQMDVAHLVAGERDPTSDKWISKHSKDCPNCGVPIQRSSGCMHMTCTMCRHHFWYKCDCKFPKHEGGCKRRLH